MAQEDHTEMRVSSPKPVGLASDCTSDPEKEFSDDDDDDRNHKHRRRDTHSQSSERDTLDQNFTRPYRKRNKPFENGHPFRENESQVSENWKNYNMSSLEKEFSTKFERRRPGSMAFPRAGLDMNQRIRGNQTFPGDPGPGRGRGPGSSWNHRDPRFSSVDIASQMVPHGPIPPSLFAGRGLPNVSNAQNASWGAFGLIPGVPNGGLDSLHPIGLQGPIRGPINPSLSMGIARQRCRDFEERGYCLRGDMCPMEHGVNRIVIEDVQSLSQFNLPVSLPNAHLHGTPVGAGSLPTHNASSASLMNHKGLHNKNNKPGMAGDSLGLNGAYSGPTGANGTDLYDPDQPLWNNNESLETSASLLALHSPKNDETDSLLNEDTSDRQHVKLKDGSDSELPTTNSGAAVGSQGSSLSVWGRIRGPKSRLDVKEKKNSVATSSNYLENETKEDQEALLSAQGTTRLGKRIIAEGACPNAMEYSSKSQGDTMRIIRKPSQKAQRTVFVNGIPPNTNKKEALISHFGRFGEVVDIYIPSNSQRAFVQFSRREEAEAALKAPDAVMGNRFIKLWWANRDSIPDDGIGSGNSVSVTPHGGTDASVPPHPSIASQGKDNLQDASFPSSDQPKPVIANGPKVIPLQKKLELEQLKEELRKKQEMLDQKRNDFRRKLDQLAKQGTGHKGEVEIEQAAKRHKVGVAAETAKTTNSVAAVASLNAEAVVDKNKSVENVASHSPKTCTAVISQEPPVPKQPIQPFVPVGAPFLVNRYKLDNRPTAFKIIPPLPTSLANVSVLKEHFSPYGELSSVELEDAEAHDSTNGLDTTEKCSARITFTNRRSAERAFSTGKCWEGHNLQFTWLAPSSTGNAVGNGGRESSPSTPKGTSNRESSPSTPKGTLNRESSPSTPKGTSNTDSQSAEKITSSVSQGASVPGNGEDEHSDRTSVVTNMEKSEDSQPSPTRPTGSEKELAKEEGN